MGPVCSSRAKQDGSCLGFLSEKPKAKKQFLRNPRTNLLAKAARSAQTLCVGARIHFASRKLKKELSKCTDLDSDEEEERWEQLHRSNAELVLNHILRYQGFLAKVGQSASAKKGTLPAAWVDTLEPLQNDMPHSSYSTVQRTIRQDLGRGLDEIFEDFHEDPIASASIAQAHLAHLREGGKKVCVKVQHPGVSELMGTDLSTIEMLLWLMKKLHSDAPDLTDVAKEWRRTSKEEVDFRLEAQNASDALRAIQAHRLDVGCCHPIPEYCSKRVLTMSFVEGFKVTEADRLPPGTDREDLGSRLWEAFAMLAFQVGLIHGDPHPGNVFVELKEREEARPVLLDWGIVKRLSDTERVALAKWVVASLSLDRVLYLSAMQELGFDAAADLDYQQLDWFMQGGMALLRDTIPSATMRQFAQQRNEVEKMERQKRKEQLGKGANKKSPISKIPGTILYFFRGTQLLHDCCGELDVAVPVARVMLKYALPLLDLASASPPAPLNGAPQRSELEQAVLEKLRELESQGVLLGAQVAVLKDEASSFLCDIAFGRSGLTTGRMTEQTLVPLLDVGVGVLLTCLLLSLSRPTAAGKRASLETEVGQLWPEFSQRGKGGVTIRQLLQHQAGLHRPFSRKLNYKSFCNENKVEDSLAASPHEGSQQACRVLGACLAALLRRMTGHKKASDSLNAVLSLAGLQEEISYSGPSSRLAHAGHQLIEELSMATMWEMLEEREQRQAPAEKKPARWLSWQEFSQHHSWCADPLLVNRSDLRSGDSCATGRGLRATARALCRLHAARDVPEELLEQTRKPSRRIQVKSLAEWEELGHCLELGAGWQLLKFRRMDGQGEVVGHGHLDGSTGSVSLRLPGVSIAVLLTCVDKASRPAGRELLGVIARHLGLEATWHLDVPSISDSEPLPERLDDADQSQAILASLRRVESQLSRIADAMASGLQVSETPATSSSSFTCSLSGSWASAESSGLDELLEAFQVPAMARSLAKRAKRSLRIDENGSRFTMAAKLSLAGRNMEQSEISFTVGEAFTGELPMAGRFQGSARWAGQSLVLEKQFDKRGRSFVLEETYTATPDGRLSFRMCIKGLGELEVELEDLADRERLCRCLDVRSLMLKKELKLRDGTDFIPGGRVVGPASNLCYNDLTTMAVPGKVRLLYEDVTCTTMFDREGLPPSRALRPTDAARFPQSAAGLPQQLARHEPHVLLEGFAWKKSRHLHQWRKRWLTLTSAELKCFKSTMMVTESVLLLTETIPIRQLRHVTAEVSAPRANCLCLHAEHRKFELSFETSGEAQSWMQALSNLLATISPASSAA